MATPNETNKTLYLKLSEMGQKVFAELQDIKPGTYTAKELSMSSTDALKLPESRKDAVFMAVCAIKDDPLAKMQMRVGADDFELDFPRCRIFEMIRRCESLPGVPRAKCTFIKEDDEEYVYTFRANFTKSHSKLAALVGKKSVWEQMNYACIDIKEKRVICSDGFVLATSPLELEGSCDSMNECKLLIDPNILKKLNGWCEIKMNDTKHFAIISESGETHKIDMNQYNYVNWMKILQNPLRAFVTIEQSDIKNLSAFCKSAIKIFGLSSSFIPIDMEITECSDEIAVQYSLENESRSIRLRLKAPSTCSANITINAPFLIKSLPFWDGGLWIGDSAVILDGSNTDALMICLKSCKITFSDNRRAMNTPAISRHSTSHSESAQYLPAPYEPSYPDVTKTCIWLCSLIETVHSIAIRAEIAIKVDQLRKLAKSAGIPIEDVIEMLSVENPKPKQGQRDSRPGRDASEMSESIKIKHSEPISPYVWLIINPDVKPATIATKTAISGIGLSLGCGTFNYCGWGGAGDYAHAGRNFTHVSAGTFAGYRIRIRDGTSERAALDCNFFGMDKFNNIKTTKYSNNGTSTNRWARAGPAKEKELSPLQTSDKGQKMQFQSR